MSEFFWMKAFMWVFGTYAAVTDPQFLMLFVLGLVVALPIWWLAKNLNITEDDSP